MMRMYVARNLRYPQYPPRFKPVKGRKPVKGGRWNVRKLINGRYRAWCSGKASRWGASFYTWEYAIKWAQYVAKTYHGMNTHDDRLYRGHLNEARREYKKQDFKAFMTRAYQSQSGQG